VRKWTLHGQNRKVFVTKRGESPGRAGKRPHATLGRKKVDLQTTKGLEEKKEKKKKLNQRCPSLRPNKRRKFGKKGGGTVLILETESTKNRVGKANSRKRNRESAAGGRENKKERIEHPRPGGGVQ